MKTKALILLVAILVVAVAALATDGSGTLNLRDTVQLNGKPLAAGEYKVKWQGNGNGAVDVTVLKNNKAVATATGKLKELDKPAPYDTVIYKADGNNNKTIAEIQFSGKKATLVFE